MSPYAPLFQNHKTKYQLVCTPEVIKNEDRTYKNVYSLLRLDIYDDTVEAKILYDISRIQAVACAILDKVELSQPPLDELNEFVSELL